MAIPNLEVVVRRGGRRALWFPPRARSWVRGSADTTLWGNGRRYQIPGSRGPVSFPALFGGVHDVRVQGRPASVLHGTANIALSPYRSPTDRSYCTSR